jgi:hypothetical protein
MQIPIENVKVRFFENIYKEIVERANISIPFDNLDYGRKILENEEECERYIALYGGHHFHKLRAAFESTNFNYLNGRNIEIIDWGSGQAFATCVLIDYLIESQVKANILKITLIEPSKIATKKGCDLITIMIQNESVSDIIKIINKPLDELILEDFETAYENIKIHLFSNILDVEVFDVENLYNLIIRQFKGLNRMICTSPKNSRQRTSRLDRFYELFKNNYAVNPLFESEIDITEEVFVVSKNRYEKSTIKRYEKQFSVDLPPF